MQKGQLIWITGFSGVGKTTIATSLYNRLKQKAKNWVLIDGDCV
jgi:adenylylsulfate kinase-like enzyme